MYCSIPSRERNEGTKWYRMRFRVCACEVACEPLGICAQVVASQNSLPMVCILPFANG
jgi:hypothetical protein